MCVHLPAYPLVVGGNLQRKPCSCMLLPPARIAASGQALLLNVRFLPGGLFPQQPPVIHKLHPDISFHRMS